MVAFILFWIFCILSFVFGFNTVVTVFLWVCGGVILFMWGAVVFDKKPVEDDREMLRHKEMEERREKDLRAMRMIEEKEAREKLFREKCYAIGNFRCDKTHLKFHERIGDATQAELDIIKMFPDLF
jgi:hypothetical protein